MDEYRRRLEEIAKEKPASGLLLATLPPVPLPELGVEPPADLLHAFWPLADVLGAPYEFDQPLAAAAPSPAPATTPTSDSVYDSLLQFQRDQAQQQDVQRERLFQAFNAFESAAPQQAGSTPTGAVPDSPWTWSSADFASSQLMDDQQPPRPASAAQRAEEKEEEDEMSAFVERLSSIAHWDEAEMLSKYAELLKGSQKKE